jgi:TRAP-type C4-dicarboxylate transport system permease small subunit
VSNPQESPLGKLERLGKALEDALLVVLLTGMILLAVGQIVMRNVFDLGFIWTDELLRLLVLWLALAGAVAASRRDRHISLAVLDKLLPPRGQHLVKVLTHLFTAAVCALIARFSLAFVLTAREFGDTLLGNVPAWPLQAVMPLGFALIAWRYTLLAIGEVRLALRPEDEA